MGAEGLNPALRSKTLGLILAGGASRRFGTDKAAAVLGDRHMIAHVVARAAPQVGKLVLNAATDSADTKLSLVPDRTPGEGPLGGWLAGLRWAREQGYEYLVTFPCDTPFFPQDVVEKLHGVLPDGADCAMARCCDQTHYTFALLRVASLERLEEAFAAGMRSLKAVGGIIRCTFADFSHYRQGGICEAFFNINSPADMELARKWLRDGDHGPR